MRNHICAYAAALLLGIPTSAGGQRSKIDGTLHGTVNILIANRHGLVLVTDSRISRGGEPVDADQKLFQIDDHTICSIAGWYSSSGPSPDGEHFPYYAAIPNVVTAVARFSAISPSQPLESKLRAIANTLIFTLDEVAEIATAAGKEVVLPTSELLIGTVEQGKTRVVKARFLPNVDSRGEVQYTLVAQPVIEVGEGVSFLTAGLDQYAAQILTHPVASDPQSSILHYYAESMQKDGGSSLTTLDLQQVGRSLETYTVKRYPKLVGGPVQVAVIEAGLVKIVEQPYKHEENVVVPRVIALVHDSEFSHNGRDILRQFKGALVVRSTIEYQPQRLDHVLFFRTRFDHCQLTYDGSPDFYLDTSNAIFDSVLTLGSGVDPNSATIQQLHRNFPTLLIKRSQQN